MTVKVAINGYGRIGRNILRDVMLIDVGKEYATELPESIRNSNGNES